MKKLSQIFCLLLILNIFVLGCSSISITNPKNSLKLNILEATNDRILASEEDSNVKYEIPNSNIEITDINNNSSSWNDLQKAKTIEVYYSGNLKEVSPVIFEKIDKIVIIS
ncbi:MAG: hypothetical protein E7214_16710 [Clostridium sp.]|nr:hypothetical protein [Clostridium sp.]